MDDLISRQAAIDAIHGRIFQEIVVEYPSYNTYTEYKGKPYFSIKYTENGQEFIGYGTYKPEVLSEYLKEYFMPSVQPEIIRCRDCVYSHMTYGGDCKNCDKWEEMYESGESLYLKGDFFCGFGERKTDD